MKLISSAFLGLLFAAGAVQAQGVDCKTLIEMHGYASRAQFQCAIANYNQEVINNVRSCVAFNKMSDTSVKRHLSLGMQNFDKEERKTGRKQACNTALKMLPMFFER